VMTVKVLRYSHDKNCKGKNQSQKQGTQLSGPSHQNERKNRKHPNTQSLKLQ